jgi:hypothetical protein
MKRAPACTKLEGEITSLADLPRPDLIDRWKALYRSSPPKGLSRRLLVLAIAYRMQVKRYGGLTPALRRRLHAAAGADAARGEAKTNGAPPVAIDGVQRSPRYPGGMALRFARVKGYREDKDPDDADTVDTVRAILERRS